MSESREADRAWELYNSDSLPGSNQTPIYRLIRSVFVSGYESGQRDRTKAMIACLEKVQTTLEELNVAEGSAALKGVLIAIKEEWSDEES